IFFGKNNFKCTWMISKGGRQMALEIFRRKEQKYLITKDQYDELVNRISPKMRSDKNGIDGKYTVTSLYFESPYKTIYFETKQKHKKVVNKRRMLLPLKEAKRYLSQNLHHPLLNYETSNEQVMREIHYFRQLYALYPEMIVSYDRHALHGIEDTELRMTFDFN